MARRSMLPMLAALALVAAPGPGPASPAERAERTCGEHVVAITPGSLESGGGEIEILDGAGRRAWRWRAREVAVGVCTDVMGGGAAHLIVAARSDCCTTFQVLSLDGRVRPVLRWEAGPGTILVPVADEADEPALLRGSDHRLAGFADADRAGRSALPVVFCPGARGFEDCTRSLRARDIVLEEWVLTLGALRLGAGPFAYETSLRLLGLGLLLGQEDEAWHWIRSLAPDALARLVERRGDILRCLERPIVLDRDQRFTVCR